jgi:hypothetical protein
LRQRPGSAQPAPPCAPGTPSPIPPTSRQKTSATRTTLPSPQTNDTPVPKSFNKTSFHLYYEGVLIHTTPTADWGGGSTAARLVLVLGFGLVQFHKPSRTLAKFRQPAKTPAKFRKPAKTPAKFRKPLKTHCKISQTLQTPSQNFANLR